MIVDFHVHSTASDGTCSPAELAARADRFAVLALTDHDNVDGVAELKAAPSGARLLAGIELSIDPGAGFDQFHLLGLGVDPESSELKDFLQRVLAGRNARNERIIDNFRRLGIDMREPAADGRTIYDYAHGEVLARPHFARWLMARQLVADPADAFARYLAPDAPAATRCYESRWHPPQAEAIQVIHAAGGLAVMAHPKYWRREWKTVGCDYAAAARELAALKERGLDGVEARYQANTPEENVEFVRMTARLGLLASAGSDFHGANKPTIPLGMEVDETYIAPLMERLGL